MSYGEDTLCGLFHRQALRYGNSYPFLTARYDSKGRKIEQFCSRTWAETRQEVLDLARGLMASGITRGDRVVMFSESRPRWIIADQAIQACGAISVTLYPTLTETELAYMVKDSDSRMIIASTPDKAQMALRVFKDRSTITIITMAPWEGERPPNVYEWSEIVARGQEIPLIRVEESIKSVTPDDIVSIVYTSGTTGKPKGVILTHRNFMANIHQCTASELIQKTRSRDLHLKSLVHLPLSHVYGRTCDYHVNGLYLGGELVFAESYETIARDLKEVRPHLLATIPRLFEKMYEIVITTVNRLSPRWRLLFQWAMRQGEKYVDSLATGRLLLPHELLFFSLANLLVFERLKRLMGLDRLVYAISGGGKLAPEIATFIRALGIQLSEGYGLTETSPVINFNAPELIIKTPSISVGKKFFDFMTETMINIMVERQAQGKSPYRNPLTGLALLIVYYTVARHLRVKPGFVGRPVLGTEEKLASDGEILVRGPQIFKGYWNNPEETNAAFTEDGFFKTGDIGIFDEEGFLKITDRKKEIFITSGGKNIAPHPIEVALLSRPYIDQVCLVGDGRKYITALIVPDFETLHRFAKENEITCTSTEELISHPEVKQLIAREVEEVNRGLPRYEQIKYFTLLPQPFRVETGELTHTMKVRRRIVLEKYRDLIEQMYTHTMKE
ncbi:MAG: long-chain fatty acid--CoA ligase [Syntrophales bacterium]|nr:long-chain fatty acid--CoA ligase [Syntrophales bacterium]